MAPNRFGTSTELVKFEILFASLSIILASKNWGTTFLGTNEVTSISLKFRSDCLFNHLIFFSVGNIFLTSCRPSLRPTYLIKTSATINVLQI